MKHFFWLRLRRGLFPDMPESFTNRIRAALPSKSPLSRIRIGRVLGVAAAGTVVAACMMLVIFGTINGWNSSPRGTERTNPTGAPATAAGSADPAATKSPALTTPAPEAPEPIAPVSEEPSVVGIWSAAKIDMNGVIVSASAIGGNLMRIVFQEDGTANIQESTYYRSPASYTFDGSTVTLTGSDPGQEDVLTMTYDAEKDTLTMHGEADGDRKIIFCREQPKQSEQLSAIGTWSHVTGLDAGIDITIRDDGTAEVTGWRTQSETPIPFTYTTEDGVLSFKHASEGMQRSFTARYDKENDMLAVTMDGSTVDYKRKKADLTGKWSLTGEEIYGIPYDAANGYVRVFLELSEDETITITYSIITEVKQDQYRYSVSGNTLDLYYTDTEDPLDIAIPSGSFVYMPGTDTLRLSDENGSSVMIFSRTPDAEIPKPAPKTPMVIGKWSLAGIEVPGTSSTPFMTGTSTRIYAEFLSDGTTVWTTKTGDEISQETYTYRILDGNQIEILRDGEPVQIITYDGAADSLRFQEPKIVGTLVMVRASSIQIPQISDGEPADVGSLRTAYPEYFGLDTVMGLTVYVRQEADGAYACVLLSAADTKSEDEIVAMRGVTVEQMRLILSTYDVPAKWISVVPFRNPLSDDSYEIDADYRKKVTEFFKDSSDTLAAAVFDIDKDGTPETCRLTRGQTTDRNTVVFTVSRNGTVVYRNTFEVESGTLRFKEGMDGKTWFIVRSSVSVQSGGETEADRYTIWVSDGVIHLTGWSGRELRALDDAETP